MAKATIQLEGLACPSCMQKIEGATKALNGVTKESIKVLFNSSKVKLEFDPSVITIEEIENAITTVGYDVTKSQVKA
jgi:copper chaperone